MKADKFDPERLSARLEKLKAQAGRRRVNAIRKNGYPPKWFDAMYIEQAGKCHYCCRPMTKRKDKRGPATATVDHLMPISRGGETRRKNLKLACAKCNTEKGALTEAEFLNVLRPSR